jgi:hypothetical protein
LLQPRLGKIPEELKPFIEREEDELTYALFPQVAVDFFKKRELKRREKADALTPEQQELEEVAALSVAVGAFLKSTHEVKAVIPRQRAGERKISPWTLAARQESTRQGG